MTELKCWRCNHKNIAFWIHKLVDHYGLCKWCYKEHDSKELYKKIKSKWKKPTRSHSATVKEGEK